MSLTIRRATATIARTRPVVLFIVLGLVLFSFHGKLSGGEDDRRVGAFNGIKEFTTTGTFLVPENVSTVLVEIYGAGGGAGGGVGGCNGGEGAFSRSVIKVWPHATLDISVGAGGRYGATPGANGGDGGNSSVSFNGSQLITAYGGMGGQGATGPKDCVLWSGPGGGADPTAMISHQADPGEAVAISL